MFARWSNGPHIQNNEESSLVKRKRTYSQQLLALCSAGRATSRPSPDLPDTLHSLCENAAAAALDAPQPLHESRYRRARFQTEPDQHVLGESASMLALETLYRDDGLVR